MVMETEQKIQNQDMEQGQKIQEPNQEIKIEKRLKLTHRVDDYGEYMYTRITIYVNANVTLNQLKFTISRYKTIDAYVNDKPEQIVERVGSLVKDLESEVISKAKHVIEIDKKVKEYATRENITLVTE